MTARILARDENGAYSEELVFSEDEVMDLIIECREAVEAMNQLASISFVGDDQSYVAHACSDYLVSRWRPVEKLLYSLVSCTR